MEPGGEAVTVRAKVGKAAVAGAARVVPMADRTEVQRVVERVPGARGLVEEEAWALVTEVVGVQAEERAAAVQAAAVKVVVKVVVVRVVVRVAVRVVVRVVVRVAATGMLSRM